MIPEISITGLAIAFVPALVVIGIMGALCWIIAFFAVLLTGEWPEGLRVWVMKLMRVWIRFSAYALMLTDEYPPFATD